MTRSEPTIADVARHAGVAISTVSRVLNDLDRVSAETRRRVLDSVEALSFRPNLAAKTLKAKKSGAIGFICEDISSPFIPDLLRGIDETARPDGYDMVLCHSDWNHDTTIRHLDMLVKRDIDGIIYSTPMRLGGALLKKLMAINSMIPLVIVSEELLDEHFVRIETAVSEGMDLVMDHLLDLGHRRISMISGPEDSNPNAVKIARYSARMEAAGFARHIRVAHTNFSIEQAITAATGMLSAPPAERPTAIISAADLSIIGALTAAKRIGLSAPADLSLVGWGGIEFGRYTDPPITSIMVPRHEIGIRAMRRLSELMCGSVAGTHLAGDRLPLSLAIRGSSGPAPTSA